ncbi:hypothetical protein, variant 2 [Blastomyces gilchristii SLH14081]|uniref:Uncharacterized protein n=1 Tax=Blastomyces gilchristii (strain SLH14081) TaxID=559298 RepID=A0A179UES3_BLAGS|nr:hypothetical protein, variant 2 [Blastomyces gilchristii SLH14081]OAT06516.1 hypothetical protein, variant 2 [Blastomyces gilchristii SLH14081]
MWNLLAFDTISVYVRRSTRNRTISTVFTYHPPFPPPPPRGSKDLPTLLQGFDWRLLNKHACNRRAERRHLQGDKDTGVSTHWLLFIVDGPSEAEKFILQPLLRDGKKTSTPTSC